MPCYFLAVPWNHLDQGAFRSAKAVKAGLLNNSVWALHGAPSDYTKLHGYDRTSYNHQVGHIEIALTLYPRSTNIVWQQ